MEPEDEVRRELHPRTRAPAADEPRPASEGFKEVPAAFVSGLRSAREDEDFAQAYLFAVSGDGRLEVEDARAFKLTPERLGRAGIARRGIGDDLPRAERAYGFGEDGADDFARGETQDDAAHALKNLSSGAGRFASEIPQRAKAPGIDVESEDAKAA